MFYAHFVLSKKGPLAKIWLAAHWDKKLTKAHVFETNIESSVEGILQPKVKMALRTSGHLLLGIVRIYSRKAKYLLADCNEAFIKIKMAFRPGIVDLPEGNREAAVATITLPEVFHDFDSTMPDIGIDMDAQVTLNQSRAEDITLKEDYGSLTLMGDDAFEDMAFEPEAGRDGSNMEEGFDHANLLLGDEQSKEQPEETVQNVDLSNASVGKPASFDVPLKDDGFGGTVGEGLLDGESGGLFEPAGLFDDAPLGDVPLDNDTAQTELRIDEQVNKPANEHDDGSDNDMYDMGPASMDVPSPPSSPLSPGPPLPEQELPEIHENALNGIDGHSESVAVSHPVADIFLPIDMPPPQSLSVDHTTLINNEDESFALAPLDTTIIQGPERTVKTKRKRKLIVDEVKNISGEEMKTQLSVTKDIVTTLDLAPPTKRLMLWKETGGVEKLFALPGQRILSQELSKVYQRRLISRSVENEEYGIGEDDIDLDADLEQARDDLNVSALISHKKQRRDNMDQMFPQDLHMDSLHLETSRPLYASEHSLSQPSLDVRLSHPSLEVRLPHPSLDVQNYMHPHPQHHMYPHSQQIMSNIMPHPPPAHMIQQMLHPDLNQLTHLQDMIHPSIVDQGPPLHSFTPSIHSVPSPIVAEPYNQRVHQSIESVPNHLLSNVLPDHMQQSSMDKQLSNHSPLASQLNQQTLQGQLSQANNHLSPIENNLHHCADNEIIQSHIDRHVLHPPVDEDITQPCLEDFTQPLENSDVLSATMPSILTNNDHNTSVNDSNAQHVTSQEEINQKMMTHHESNEIFDPVSNRDNASHINLHIQNDVNDSNVLQNDVNDNTVLQNDVNDNTVLQNDVNDNTIIQNDVNDNNVIKKTVEFPISDDDDYGAPPSVGPALPEEQMVDETYEQFEERILTKRTTHMLHIINSKLDEEKCVSFASVVRNCKRKQVAQKFYTFLVLKKQQAVELEQNSSYSDLIITKGPRFSVIYNST